MKKRPSGEPGPVESMHPPPNRDGESSESEEEVVEEDPQPKERPWKRRRS